jgi:cytoskeletal protein CcmA (bactofilin family)
MSGASVTGNANCAYVGEGCVISGRIEVPDSIVIDGIVEGDLAARSIRVGPTGSVKGNIVTTEADIHGSVSQSLEVKQLLTVRSTGRINGSVLYGELLLEQGAVITGEFASTDFRSDKKTSKDSFQSIEKLRFSYDAPSPKVISNP